MPAGSHEIQEQLLLQGQLNCLLLFEVALYALQRVAGRSQPMNVLQRIHPLTACCKKGQMS
jgi:hypothetical protein